MSNLIQAIMEWKKLDKFINEFGIVHDLIDSDSLIIKDILSLSMNRSNGIEIHAIKEIPKDECVSIIVDAMKASGVKEVYCSLGQVDKPYVIRLDMDNMKHLFNMEYLDSKSVTVYATQLDGCCIVDLPTVGAIDFGIVLFGSFRVLGNDIRTSLATPLSGGQLPR